MTRNKGFSILEVLIGIAIFMFGMMGIAALQISSINGSSFAANLSEATFLATSKFEELMNMSYSDSDLDDDDDDGGRITNQDKDSDGVDDDDDNASGNADGLVNDGTLNFGLDDIGCGPGGGCGAEADGLDSGVGRNNQYDVYWNVAEGHPLPNCKTIKVYTVWSVKGNARNISMTMVKEEVK